MNRKPIIITVVVLLLMVVSGCSARKPIPGKSVSQAWRQARGRGAEQGAAATTASEAARAAPAAPIATVFERPIDRERVVQLLLAGRGVDVLEQVILLDLAREAAEAAGLYVVEKDIRAEEDLALRQLLSPLPAAGEGTYDREAARRVLDQILANRGVSAEEYELGLLRNAYLRKLARARLMFTDDELYEEFERAFGDRVSARHIQLASASDVALVRQMLASGMDFVDVARGKSANAVTAAEGGSLRPFSRDDPDVPEALRVAAFELEPGVVSDPIQAGNWVHLLRVEKRLPAAEVAFEQVRDELAERLRERRLPTEMQAVSSELFGQAEVQIDDPALAERFFSRHPELRRNAR